MSGSFTYDNLLERIASGAGDWDSNWNANVDFLERGRHAKVMAGTAINSGQVCVLNNSACALPMHGQSFDNIPWGISYRAASSGDLVPFVTHGIVRSMAIWSGHIQPGQGVYVSTSSLGWPVSSFQNHGRVVGRALGHDAIQFNPGAGAYGFVLRLHRLLTDTTTITDAATLSWNAMHSASYFVQLGGNRAIPLPTELFPGWKANLEVKQDSTGNRTLTWDAGFKWASGSVSVLSTNSGDRDAFALWSPDGSTVMVVEGGKDFI